jgi:hypothetical protein
MGAFFPALKSADVFAAMLVNLFFVLLFQFMRMWPTGDCGGTCEAQGNPYGGTSRHAPALPPPFGDGNPDEAYLWLVPSFYGMITCIPSVFFFSWLFAQFPGIQIWFDKLQGVPESCLEKFGDERMDLDREGIIVKRLMAGVTEPVTHPNTWMRSLLLLPLLSVVFLPWPGYYGDDWAPMTNTAGLPTWGFNFTLVNCVGTFSLAYVCLFMWKGRPEEGVSAMGGGRRSSFGGEPEWNFKKGHQVQVKAASNQVMPTSLPPGAIEDDMQIQDAY